MAYLFPNSKNLILVLKQLLNIEFETKSEKLLLAENAKFKPDGKHLISLWQDRSGSPIAGVLFDSASTFYLGGTFLGMMQNSIKNEASTGKIPEVFIESVSEISNTLTNTFNVIKDNPHVRSESAKSFSSVSQQAPWIPTPASSLLIVGECYLGPWNLRVIAKN